MVKRRLMGVDYGVCIISEGVFHFIEEKEVIDTKINFTYDEHGHPELGNVSKSHIFNMLTQQELKKHRIVVKSRPNELGYELRCCRPIAFDLNYATRLGLGVFKLFKEGKTGCMVTVSRNGDIVPLFLKDVEDENGKVRPRLVNVESENVQLIYQNNLHYITRADYKAAKKYIENPEDFDFFKILNWDEQPGIQTV
jgi:6-phosphofructokinase 1